MTATDELRAMLDERGGEWRYHINDDKTRTWFNVGKLAWFAYETPQGYLVLDCSPMTPEQAIEATLGRGTCKVRLYKPEHGSSDCTICECGEINDISANYCNRCGRQIKVVWE